MCNRRMLTAFQVRFWFLTVFQIHFLRDSDSGRETGKKRLRDQLLTDACNWKQDVSSDSGKGDVLNEFNFLKIIVVHA